MQVQLKQIKISLLVFCKGEKTPTIYQLSHNYILYSCRWKFANHNGNVYNFIFLVLFATRGFWLSLLNNIEMLITASRKDTPLYRYIDIYYSNILRIGHRDACYHLFTVLLHIKYE